MRHRVAHRKLGRVTEHRIAMLRSQASALIEHERIETTVARAKELRPFVERIISVAKRSLKNTDSAIGNVNARRTVAADIFNRDVVTKLFGEIAPRYADRSGGYTRMLRLGRRRGDDAEIAQVELIGSEFDPAAEAKKTEGEGGEAPTRKRTIGERVRALGGGKKNAEKTKAPKAKTSKGAGRKITAPRKAGGA
jgi:large subunit ribosomal protein L17